MRFSLLQKHMERLAELGCKNPNEGSCRDIRQFQSDYTLLKYFYILSSTTMKIIGLFLHNLIKKRDRFILHFRMVDDTTRNDIP